MKILKKHTAKYLIASIVIGFLFATVNLSPSFSTELKTLKVACSHPVLLPNLAYYVGIEKGFFKNEGLNVAITAMRGGGETIRAITTRTFDIGGNTSFSSPISAFSKGVPIRIIAGQYNNLESSCWMVLPDSPINSYEDIKKHPGIKIGFSRPQSVTHIAIRSILKNLGIDPEKDVNLVPVGGLSSSWAALKSKQVDVTWTQNPILAKIFDQVKTLGWSRDYLPEFPMTCTSAHADMLKERPEDVRGFLRAWKNSIVYIQSNYEKKSEELAEIFGKHVSGVTKESFLKQTKYTPPGGWSYRVNWKSVEVVNKAVVEIGMIKKPVDINKLIDESLSPK